MKMIKLRDLHQRIDIPTAVTSRYIFSMAFAMLFFYAHRGLSDQFIHLHSFKITIMRNTTDLVALSPGRFEILCQVYLKVSLIALLIIGFVTYRTFFETLIHQKSDDRSPPDEEIIEPPFPWCKEELQLIIGLKHSKLNLDKVKAPEWVTIPEKAIFQNFLISGTIGTGKTASMMYPLTKQAIFYSADNKEEKAGMLILDVKGNFYEQVLGFARDCGRENDVILIKLGGEYKYNPLHKPQMEAIDLAERSRIVMDLFSGGGKKEAFWDTKSAQMMCECIRLMRMVNGGYVTLGDVHSLVTDESFLEERLNKLYELQDKVPEFDFRSCTNYFNGEFHSKAENTVETVKACVTEMTAFFASSERIYNSFCPSKAELNFLGFQEAINLGKIVVLAMNVAEYPKVSKTIAAYLKLDFQAEVQQRTVPGKGLNQKRPVFFLSDEYQEFVTSNDGNFYGVSREARCCSIVASQSYTSLLKTLGDDKAFNTLQQNLINKIWLRSDDKLTFETAQLLTGREEKRRVSKNISESAADTKKSRIFGRLLSDKASISESINISTQKEHTFDEKVFTQTLELFKGVCFLAHETGMQEPTIVHLMPYFQSPVQDKIQIERPKAVMLKLWDERTTQP